LLVEESIFLGFLGALSFVLIQLHHHGVTYWKDKKAQIVSHILLGPVCGYLVWLLVIHYGWTNHLTAYLAGVSGPFFIEGLVAKKAKTCRG